MADDIGFKNNKIRDEDFYLQSDTFLILKFLYSLIFVFVE
jgi:hypothetical protein